MIKLYKNIAAYALAGVMSVTLFGMLAGCAANSSLLGGGRPAPDFSVTLMDGKIVKLADFAGKPFVLNFGAAYCPHCIHELPTFKAVHEKYGDDVGILMVFGKGDEPDAREKAKEHNLRFKVAYEDDAHTSKTYGVTGIPKTFFIDADGMIVDEYLGSVSERNMFKKIDALMTPDYVPDMP
jgi:peroxiredoxin